MPYGRPIRSGGWGANRDRKITFGGGGKKQPYGSSDPCSDSCPGNEGGCPDGGAVSFLPSEKGANDCGVPAAAPLICPQIRGPEWN